MTFCGLYLEICFQAPTEFEVCECGWTGALREASTPVYVHCASQLLFQYYRNYEWNQCCTTNYNLPEIKWIKKNQCNQRTQGVELK